MLKTTNWDKSKELKWPQDNPTKCMQKVALLEKEVVHIENIILKSIDKKAKWQKELQTKIAPEKISIPVELFSWKCIAICFWASWLTG